MIVDGLAVLPLTCCFPLWEGEVEVWVSLPALSGALIVSQATPERYRNYKVSGKCWESADSDVEPVFGDIVSRADEDGGDGTGDELESVKDDGIQKEWEIVGGLQKWIDKPAA